MSRITFNQWAKKILRRRRNKRKTRNLRRTPSFEQLGERIMPAVNAFFTAGHLTILGDAQDNTIVVSRDAAGAMLVNGGAVQRGRRNADRRQRDKSANLRPRRQRHPFAR